MGLIDRGLDGKKQMTIVKIEKKRSNISDTPDGLTISIPSGKNWFIIIFLTIWLAGWIVGEITAPLSLFWAEDPGDRFFTITWLIGWTIAGSFFIFVWLWSIFGKEIITVNSVYLVIKRDILGWGKLRQYQVSHIKDIRVSTFFSFPWSFESSMQFWGIGGGLIAFDYGPRTYRFASGVDEAEAKEILKSIFNRFPDIYQN